MATYPDSEGVLQGWDGEAIEDGNQGPEFRREVTDDHGDFAVLYKWRFL
jgi:hypothetical protein